ILLTYTNSKLSMSKLLGNNVDNLIRYNLNEQDKNESQEVGKLLRAFIEATREHRSENASITSGMLAAQGINSNLLLPLQDTYKAWQDKIERDGLDKVDATIIRLAVDDLWLSEVFGLDALDESMRSKVLERLTSYTEKNRMRRNDA